MYNGLISVYKEADYTSFDVVACLRGILKQKKIGHTGTLDPKAEGVLLVCLGNGTKLVDMLEDRSKEYECKMLLGTTTDTEDTTGKVLTNVPVNEGSYSEKDITNVIMSFEGGYDQIPPMYSALKVGGKKLYELAREGKEIERKPRPVVLSNIVIKSIELPYVTFSVSCSKGTYIRSLCRDIGEKLGCGACMEYLLRTRVGAFSLDTAKKLDEIRELTEKDIIDSYIFPVEKVFEELPVRTVSVNAKKKIDNGNPLELSDFTEEVNIEESRRYRIHNAEGKFVAVYSYNEEKGLLSPEKMFMS